MRGVEHEGDAVSGGEASSNVNNSRTVLGAGGGESVQLYCITAVYRARGAQVSLPRLIPETGWDGRSGTLMYR